MKQQKYNTIYLWQSVVTSNHQMICDPHKTKKHKNQAHLCLKSFPSIGDWIMRFNLCLHFSFPPHGLVIGPGDKNLRKPRWSCWKPIQPGEFSIIQFNFVGLQSKTTPLQNDFVVSDFKLGKYMTKQKLTQF